MINWRIAPFVALVSTSLCCISSGREDLRTLRVTILPLGKVDVRLISEARQLLISELGIHTTVLPAQRLPKIAYCALRDRYRADRIIKWLPQQLKSDGKIVGVTSVDLSTTKGSVYDWGLFGLGSLGGRACVACDYRLGRKGVKSRARRFAEVLVHEVGHTLGLEHCATPRCIMHDAEGSLKTVDESNGKFCSKCRLKLGRKS